MSEQRMQAVLDRWTEDESFRTQLRSDPEGRPARSAQSSTRSS
jgi:hypothetical protein